MELKPLAQNREQIEPWPAMHSLSRIQNVTISVIFEIVMICALSQWEKMETFHSYSLARCSKRTLDPLNTHENVYSDYSDTLRNSHTTPETTPLPETALSRRHASLKLREYASERL